MPYLNIALHATKLYGVQPAEFSREIAVSPSAEGEVDCVLTKLRENSGRISTLTGNVHSVV